MATIVPVTSLETVLAGYELLVDSRLYLSSVPPDVHIENRIDEYGKNKEVTVVDEDKTKLPIRWLTTYASSLIGCDHLDDLDEIIGELVIQNLFQHACDTPCAAAFYGRPDEKALLGVFTFNGDRSSAEGYIRMLRRADKIANKADLGKKIYSMPDDIPLGTVLTLRNKAIIRIGIAEQASNYFIFFEYCPMQ